MSTPTAHAKQSPHVFTLLAMLFSIGSLFAVGGGALLEAESAALEKELELHDLTCQPGQMRNAPADEQQRCADDRRALVKRLRVFVHFCDQLADGEKDIEKTMSLQKRAANYHIDCIDRYGTAQCLSERDAIRKERAQRPAGSHFDHIGLLADDAITGVFP